MRQDKRQKKETELQRRQTAIAGLKEQCERLQQQRDQLVCVGVEEESHVAVHGYAADQFGGYREEEDGDRGDEDSDAGTGKGY